MSDENLQLIEPSVAYVEAFTAYATECAAADAPSQRKRYREALRDVAGYIGRLQDWGRGVGVASGLAPMSTYWLVRDGRDIVATSNIRHYLTPHLEHEGGHIGYGVRPSERRKGYGTLVCALTLGKAREMGLARVLITCDTDNVASARIIEKNGGRFENQVLSTVTGKLKSRYWVAL